MIWEIPVKESGEPISVKAVSPEGKQTPGKYRPPPGVHFTESEILDSIQQTFFSSNHKTNPGVPSQGTGVSDREPGAWVIPDEETSIAHWQAVSTVYRPVVPEVNISILFVHLEWC